MTIEEEIQYYANLLIVQYRNLPRAQATMQALAREVIAENISLQVQSAFNVDPSLGPVAVGVQVDVMGKYVGILRRVLTFSGGRTLNDADYLTMIRAKLNLNNSNFTLQEIDELLFTYLGNAIVAFDQGGMQMGYFFNSTLGSQTLAEAFVKLDLLPRPMAVQVSSLLYAETIDNCYGWATNTQPAVNTHGFNTDAHHDDTSDSNRWLDDTNILNLI